MTSPGDIVKARLHTPAGLKAPSTAVTNSSLPMWDTSNDESEQQLTGRRGSTILSGPFVFTFFFVGKTFSWRAR